MIDKVTNKIESKEGRDENESGWKRKGCRIVDNISRGVSVQCKIY